MEGFTQEFVQGQGSHGGDILTNVENKNATISLPVLVEDIKQLGMLLAMETEYLKEMQVDNIKVLQDEKLKFVHKLELQKKLIAYNPGVVVDRTAQGVEELKYAQQALDSIMVENQQELLKAKELNRLVVDAVVEAVEEQMKQSQGYGSGGAGAKASNADMPALSINEVI